MTTGPHERLPHALPADVHEQVYVDEVRRRTLESTRSGGVRKSVPLSEQIQVTVFSGRPAVGKSTVIHRLTAGMPREPAIISGDEIGTYDPRWPELLRQDDLTAGSVVYHDSRKMAARAIEECLHRRFDFVVDTNSDNPQRTRDLLNRLRTPDENGRPLCHVRFVGVSAPQAMADLAVLDRLQQERETNGGGRYVDNADRGYPGVLETAAMVERECLADETYVFARSEPEPVYSNVLATPDRYLRPPGFVEAMEATRHQPWSAPATEDFRDRTTDLAGLSRRGFSGHGTPVECP
ncbi:zeta toxin family protein [Dactylosporangium sp. NPDC005555]|uniref:zeta toxin family protein n=1 Tax=Dactylosporangium sp. NPDC005555 TaxID=3154889 RepID=UPI0033A241A9